MCLHCDAYIVVQERQENNLMKSLKQVIEIWERARQAVLRLCHTCMSPKRSLWSCGVCWCFQKRKSLSVGYWHICTKLACVCKYNDVILRQSYLILIARWREARVWVLGELLLYCCSRWKKAHNSQASLKIGVEYRKTLQSRICPACIALLQHIRCQRFSKSLFCTLVFDESARIWLQERRCSSN